MVIYCLRVWQGWRADKGQVINEGEIMAYLSEFLEPKEAPPSSLVYSLLLYTTSNDELSFFPATLKDLQQKSRPL